MPHVDPVELVHFVTSGELKLNSAALQRYPPDGLARALKHVEHTKGFLFQI
jgi:hypothetical protein